MQPCLLKHIQSFDSQENSKKQSSPCFLEHGANSEETQGSKSVHLFLNPLKIPSLWKRVTMHKFTQPCSELARCRALW